MEIGYKKRLIRFAKYFTFFTIAIVFLYFVLGFQMPAMKKRIFIFAIWFFAEIYLWVSIFRTFDFFSKTEKKSKKRKITELIFTILYWIPALIIAIMLFFLVGKGIQNIDTSGYLAVMGICVIQYLIKFILFFLLIGFDVVTYFMRRFPISRFSVKILANVS